MLPVLFWWWICFLVYTGSGHPFYKFELDVRDGCREGHGIAAVGAEGEIEDEYLLELGAISDRR
jgi:hypothetical protein